MERCGMTLMVFVFLFHLKKPLADIKPEHKAINLMRWIRKQLEENDAQRNMQAAGQI
jgi:hypothetical protein